MNTRIHKHLRHINWGKPTKVFKRYAWLLALRVCVFGLGVFLFFEYPEELDVSKNFGPAAGLSYSNLLFVLMLADMLTKMFPGAHIAMGSLKQYRSFHAPTPATFRGGKDGLVKHMESLLARGEEALDKIPPEVVHKVPHGDAAVEKIRQSMQATHKQGLDLYQRGRLVLDQGRAAVSETYVGLRDAAEQLLRSIDVLRILPVEDEDLTADQRMRARIRADRFRQTIPVLVMWVALNGGLGYLLFRLNLLSDRVVLMWTSFYFVFDMVCVVFWCPLQLLMMRNRCCTTCQIFNWDAIMYTTPLLFLRSPFSLLLVGAALVVLVRWELAFIRHPERFDERTNASLKCANCSDKLCYLRGSLRELQPQDVLQNSHGVL